MKRSSGSTYHHDRYKILSLFTLFFLLPACAPHDNIREDPDFESRKIYVITASTVEGAYHYRESILKGNPYPKTKQILPITDLDLIDPSLIKTAVQLDECEITDPIRLTSQDSPVAKFILLQRPKTSFRPCTTPDSSFSETLKKIDEKGGEILIGLLLIGTAVFGLLAPFIFGFF